MRLAPALLLLATGLPLIVSKEELVRRRGLIGSFANLWVGGPEEPKGSFERNSDYEGGGGYVDPYGKGSGSTKSSKGGGKSGLEARLLGRAFCVVFVVGTDDEPMGHTQRQETRRRQSSTCSSLYLLYR